MRTTTRRPHLRRPALAAASVLAAAGVVLGAGPAGAQTDTDVDPGCLVVANPQGVGMDVCMVLEPGAAGEGTSLGYGSAGTQSAADLLSSLVQTGSALASLGIPQATGVLLPGSTGSYGPVGVVGQLSAESTGSLISGSVG